MQNRAASDAYSNPRLAWSKNADGILRRPVGTLMPKGVAKADLPTKTCAACARPFAWRKKWERDWENVRYCSDACRAKGGKAT